MIIYNNEWYPETDNQVRYFELLLVLCQLMSATVLAIHLLFMAGTSFLLGKNGKKS